MNAEAALRPPQQLLPVADYRMTSLRVVWKLSLSSRNR